MLRRPWFATLHTPVCAALLLLLLFSAGVSRSAAFDTRHNKRDYKREVEAIEEQWRQAQLSGDVATMDHLLSDDYVGISMNGEVSTKTQQLDRVRNHTLVLSRIDTSDRKVKIVGRVAIVTSLAHVEGTDEGASISGVYRYTRVYQGLPGGVWKITNFELTPVPSRGVPRLQPGQARAEPGPRSRLL